MKLTVEGLDVSYGRTPVLHDVALEVPDGTLVCLMGRNGVGKTTLLNTIAGLLPARRGRILLDDEDVTTWTPWKRAARGFGYVPQGHQVFGNMTTLENLQVVQEARPARRREKGAIDDALDVFPALKTLLHKPSGLLSGGQAQQLAIARALVNRPTLLVFDEPTEGIQPSIIIEIEDTIAHLHATTGISILLVEQYVEFAMRLAERYVVMDQGRVVSQGETATATEESFADLLSV